MQKMKAAAVVRISWMAIFILGVAGFALLEWRGSELPAMAWFLLSGLWSAICGIGYTVMHWLKVEWVPHRIRVPKFMLRPAVVRNNPLGAKPKAELAKKLFLLAIGAVLLHQPGHVAEAADKLECMTCHKYRGLSRVDEKGKFRLFYVNIDLFQSGPHRRIGCRECHTDIDGIPHNPAKAVNCLQQCHIAEPSGNVNFSHQAIGATLAKSVHGKLDAKGEPKPHAEDYPFCKDCHEEPLYRPISIYKGVAKHGVSERSISRCKSCHETGFYAEDFYDHVTSRLHKTRFPLETIETCAKCHQDPEFRKRHELDDVVTSYRQTFHGKLMRLGSERTPDCLDCHVVEGEKTHLIEAKTVPTSAVYKANLGRTCRASDCHTRASADLAGYQTHVSYDRKKYPLEFYMLVFFKALMALVLYSFLALVFFELMRRLFPSFSFFKDNTPHHPIEKSGNDDKES